MFSIEVIMAAYNNADFTRLVLEGYLRQTDRQYSVAIADDGSGPEIAELADQYRALGLPVRHLWHEDLGYRRAAILNKAVHGSQADYLIFTDNDCIPHPEFVADHRAVARGQQCVTGRRVNLGESLSTQLITGELKVDALFSRRRILRWALAGKLRNPENGLCLPWFISNKWSRKQKGLLGANMAVWRKDMIAVNGFDNAFQGYGAEESDLEWRLRASNVQVQSLLGRACQYHLYHESKSVEVRNEVYLREKMARGEVRARDGIVAEGE